ncbi:alkaline-phosphatase-like protein [Chytriomyces sp. MP71]|nr:alkaline-phosphatase-like protein [Chytriomyces sp. MP71]
MHLAMLLSILAASLPALIQAGVPSLDPDLSIGQLSVSDRPPANSSRPVDYQRYMLAAAREADPHSATQTSTQKTPTRPNIVLLLTDDQDVHMNSLQFMPLLQKHLIDKGTQFKNYYTTSAICCPSRVSILRGQFAHNTNFTDVLGKHGGYDNFLKKGLNEDYLPKFLQSAGYSTSYVGKFLNGYTAANHEQTPGGWNEFDTLIGPFIYDNFHPVFAKNGAEINDFKGQYQVDVIRDKALSILDRAIKEVNEQDQPFFLYMAPTAPHTEIIVPPGGFGSFYTGKSHFTEPTPAKRHEHLFESERIPRGPNFNPADVSGKPGYIARLPLLNDEEISTLDHWHRQRLRALQSVDELLEAVVKKLESAGQLDNTYIIYSSDNGFHMGLHRLNAGKTTPYEDDVNVPFIVRGPGVVPGRVVKNPFTHTDLAPTLLKLAGAENAAYPFDGRPIPIHAEDELDTHRESFSVEFWRPYESERFLIKDIKENVYRSVRIVADAYSYLYVVWCTGHRELYDHQVDPHQIHNIYSKVPVTLLHRLDALLLVLKDCVGEQCARPWADLHSSGTVQNLSEALDAQYDAFYATAGRLEIKECLSGFFKENEAVVPSVTNPGHREL